VKVNPEIVCREEFDGTGCLFNPDDGKVFGLNATSLFLWRQFEKGASAEEALAALKDACATPLPEEAAADVSAFVADLSARGFLSEK